MTPGGGLYEANVKLHSVYSGSLSWTTRPVAQVRPLSRYNVRGVCSLQPPAFAKRQAVIAGNDDVVDQLHVDQAKALFQLIRQPAIGLRRLVH